MSSAQEARIVTPLTKKLGIKHPVLLAGMGVISNTELVAAVSNAGGMGVLGGVNYSPELLRKSIAEIKSKLKDSKAPFGVDLLIPQVGGSARKTNKDYTHGTLPELIDVIIESGATMFVSAVGVPPTWAVEKLKKAGVIYANMVGSPRNAEKALEAGATVLIAQGYEAGGHTGDVATLPLIRHVVRLAKKKFGGKSIDGQPIHVVGAGGVADGEAVAACMALGAEAVWVGTRFICALESGASDRWRSAVMAAGPTETMRTLVATGRPCRMYMTPYIKKWETERKDEIKALCDKGVIPLEYDYKEAKKQGKPWSIAEAQPLFMGQCVGLIEEIKPARDIVEELVRDAIAAMQRNQRTIVYAKL